MPTVLTHYHWTGTPNGSWRLPIVRYCTAVPGKERCCRHFPQGFFRSGHQEQRKKRKETNDLNQQRKFSSENRGVLGWWHCPPQVSSWEDTGRTAQLPFPVLQGSLQGLVCQWRPQGDADVTSHLTMWRHILNVSNRMGFVVSGQVWHWISYKA